MSEGETVPEINVDEHFHQEMSYFEKIGMEITMHASLDPNQFQFAMKMLSSFDNALLRFAGAFSLNQIMKNIRQNKAFKEMISKSEQFMVALVTFLFNEKCLPVKT